MTDPVNACSVCGFEAAEWDERDSVRMLRHGTDQLVEIADGAGPDPRWTDLRARAGALPRPRNMALGDLRSAMHDLTHLLCEAGRLRWSGTARQTGQIVQVNTSTGGVPKRPVERATVDRRGLTGDRQAERAHHGAPTQALCLWSAEVIAALAAEGHPIGAGRAGENVTLAGLSWDAVQPGMRLRLGTVLAETTGWATPCTKNARWFTGGDFRRMGQSLHPGWSRIYARVLEPGALAAGDEAVLEP